MGLFLSRILKVSRDPDMFLCQLCIERVDLRRIRICQIEPDQYHQESDVI